MRRILLNRLYPRIYMAHEHPELPHYHLFVRKASTGTTVEISELFRDSNPTYSINAGTIADIKERIKDQFFWANPDNICLSWRGTVLEPDTLEIGNIVVDQERIMLYKPDVKWPIIAYEK